MAARIHHTFLFSVFLGVMPSQAVSMTCNVQKEISVPAKKEKGKAIEAKKLAYQLLDGSVIFLGRLTIDADGHPRAYHPDRHSGLDYLANGGKPGNWWALATDDGKCGKKGKPYTQQSDEPAPGFYVTRTTMTNPAEPECRRQENYVHSGKIPYVAISGKIMPYNYSKNSGNLAYVFSIPRKSSSGALFADVAPSSGIGEGSMYLAKQLGYSSSPKNGGTHTRENVFVLFNTSMRFPKGEGEVLKNSNAAFKAWGGDDKLKACVQYLLERKRNAEQSHSGFDVIY